MKKITAITVCVGYSDFLCWVLPENKNIFNKWIIVTDTKDTETKNLCENYNVFCIQTDVFYQNKNKFNKYAGINEALKYVDNDSWVIFLDSDIVLHHLSRRVFDSLELNEKFIYGIDRVNCVGLENWLNYIRKRDALFKNWMLHSSGMELGARLVHYYGEERDKGKYIGWRPLGFFQMCHRSAFDSYPQNTIGADHCDLEFVRHWERSKRVLIPELLGIHLESVGATKGINWYGRKSQPFTLDAKTNNRYKFLLKIITLKNMLVNFIKQLTKNKK
jgi:hypothetical protein